MLLTEEVALEEKGEVRAPVHVPLEQLRLGTQTFCASIVERQTDRGIHGLAIELDTAG